PNLAPAGPACAPGFAYAKWRKIVVQNESLRLFAATVGINHLRLFDRSECGERERLGFTALKNRRTVCARQYAYFAADRTQICVTSAIDAFLFFQNADAKRFLLNVIERLRDRERISLRIFFQDRRLHFFTQYVHSFGARHL